LSREFQRAVVCDFGGDSFFRDVEGDDFGDTYCVDDWGDSNCDDVLAGLRFFNRSYDLWHDFKIWRLARIAAMLGRFCVAKCRAMASGSDRSTPIFRQLRTVRGVMAYLSAMVLMSGI